MICRYTSELKSILRVSRGSLVLLLFIGAACGGDDTGIPTATQLPPDTTTTAPTDTVSTPPDTVATPPSDTTVTSDSTVTDSTALPPVVDSVTPGSSLLPGITFGSFTMPTSYLSNVQNGTMLGGPLSPSNIV